MYYIIIGMIELATKKLEEIASGIFLKCRSDLKKEQSEGLGLFSGDFGILLFLAYYSGYSGQLRYKKMTENYLEWCLDGLSRGVYNHTYCNGLSGMLYALHHLSQNHLIDVDMEEAEIYLDKWLSLKLKEDIAGGRYDFLHGALGVGLYDLKKGAEQKREELTLLLDFLERTSVPAEEGIRWYSDFNLEGKKEFNVSLSHGMASIGLFLCRLYKADIHRERVGKLLSGMNDYLLTQEVDRNRYGSFFPPLSKDTLARYGGSRLAWCYGDLGVALELWQAGNSLNRSGWKNKAMEVFEYSAGRRDPENTKLMDACICHGTAGVAQVFKRMYYETGDKKFLETNEYWIQELLKQAHFENELAGFKYYRGKEGWKDSYSFLEGIAGIGLVLLAYAGEVFLSDWDEILLLNY